MVYIVLASGWIAVSDRLGTVLFPSPEQLTLFQTYKGAAFVVLTTLALFALLSHGSAARPQPAHPRLQGMTISTMILTLVMVTGVPFMALVGVGVYRESLNEVDKANRLVAAVTDQAASSAGAFADRQTRLAATLALRPAVRELRGGRCDPLLEGLLTMRTDLADIMTVDRDDALVCAASGGDHYPIAAPEWRDALRGGAHRYVGHPRRNPRTGEWEMVMAYALKDGVGPQGAIVLVVKLSALRPIVEAATHSGVVMSILDEERYFLARSAETPLLTGTQIPESPDVALVRARRSGEFTAAGPDGIRRLYSFRPVNGAPWVVISGVPLDTIYGVARSKAAFYGSLGILALLLAAGLVMTIARRITDPMHALSETARRVSLGHIDERAVSAGPAEVAEIATQFNHMLDKLPAIEQELRELAARNQSLVELAPDGILVQDGRTAVYANAGFRRMFGIAPGESLVHLSLVDLTETEQCTRMAARMARLEVDPGSCTAAVFQMRRTDGTMIEVEHSASSVLLHGNCIAVQSYLRDVTVRNQRARELEAAKENLEERIQERTADLQASNEALSSFTRSVAHDLRSPLAVISGFASRLARAVDKGDIVEAARHTERIQRNAKAMSGMIDGLLNIARSDVAALARGPVDMMQLAREVVQEHGGNDMAEITIGELPIVYGDETTLRQVWRNLISNALKYSAKVRSPAVDINATAEAGGWKFTVTDNGVGFDPASAPNLFKPFERLPGSEGFEGNGVGLTIARRIVERHGGSIGATGRPGEGASFHFWLPGGSVKEPGSSQS